MAPVHSLPPQLCPVRALQKAHRTSKSAKDRLEPLGFVALRFLVSGS